MLFGKNSQAMNSECLIFQEKVVARQLLLVIQL